MLKTPNSNHSLALIELLRSERFSLNRTAALEHLIDGID
jgi:hypothetical protein